MSMLTLLDLAKRTGSDPAIGLIEDVTTVAPELSVIPVRTRSGTSYKYTKRTGFPAGGFRAINEGNTPSKSTYTQELGQMFFFDGLMNVDEAIVKGDDGQIGDILAQEGSGILADTAIKIGQQIYSGVSVGPKGFAGFRATVDPAMVVDAQGTGTVENIWFAFLDDTRGIHLPVGMNGAISLGDWTRQQIQDPNDSTKSLFAHVNNLSFYMGLHIPSAYVLGVIKNVTTAAKWTDALSAAMIAKFPIGRKPNRIFATSNANYLLQTSRSTVSVVGKQPTGGSYPDRPTESQGVLITESDAVATESNW